MTYPFFGWFLYLIGILDGGHWIPIGGRLWHGASLYLRGMSLISSLFVAIWFICVLHWTNYNMSSFFIYDGGPWFKFAWWLFTITYLQHHDDTTWTFLGGALQTIDRTYGFGLDSWMLHITDCHIIHHIFFTKIPHYHLKDATTSLYSYLDLKSIPYKRKVTTRFYYDVFDLVKRFKPHYYGSHSPTCMYNVSSCMHFVYGRTKILRTSF